MTGATGAGDVPAPGHPGACECCAQLVAVRAELDQAHARLEKALAELAVAEDVVACAGWLLTVVDEDALDGAS